MHTQQVVRGVSQVITIKPHNSTPYSCHKDKGQSAQQRQQSSGSTKLPIDKHLTLISIENTRDQFFFPQVSHKEIKIVSKASIDPQLESKNCDNQFQQYTIIFSLFSIWVTPVLCQHFIQHCVHQPARNLHHHQYPQFFVQGHSIKNITKNTAMADPTSGPNLPT